MSLFRNSVLLVLVGCHNDDLSDPSPGFYLPTDDCLLEIGNAGTCDRSWLTAAECPSLNRPANGAANCDIHVKN
jgi:uncharacterized protein YgiB involved in biofilm formation